MRKNLLLTAGVLLLVSVMTFCVSAQTYSGTCGNNLTWTLDDYGTLTISGTGSMKNWSSYRNVP